MQGTVGTPTCVPGYCYNPWAMPRRRSISAVESGRSDSEAATIRSMVVSTSLRRSESSSVTSNWSCTTGSSKVSVCDRSPGNTSCHRRGRRSFLVLKSGTVVPHKSPEWKCAPARSGRGFPARSSQSSKGPGFARPLRRLATVGQRAATWFDLADDGPWPTALRATATNR